MSDDEFISAFLECRLASSDFDHRGHLRIAWLLLNCHSLEEATEQVCAGIARLATRFGAPDKFHRTISEALMRLMAHARLTGPNSSFEEYLETNRVLLQNVRGLLAQYYSTDRLNSSDARQRFVAPDLQPLP